jgi:hypothetical protein
VGSPSRIVSEILRGFLGESLRFEEISFNIGSTKLVQIHQQVTDQLMHQIAQRVCINIFLHKLLTRPSDRSGFSRVIVFVTNHSHDETGDLYMDPDFSTPVDQVRGLVTLPLNVY